MHEVELVIPNRAPIILVRLQVGEVTWVALKHLHDLLPTIMGPPGLPWSTFHRLVQAQGGARLLLHAQCLWMPLYVWIVTTSMAFVLTTWT